MVYYINLFICKGVEAESIFRSWTFHVEFINGPVNQFVLPMGVLNFFDLV